MKMKNNILLPFATLVCMLWVGCAGDNLAEEMSGEFKRETATMESQSAVITGEASSLGEATLRFRVSAVGAVRSKGIVYSTTNPTPTIRRGEAGMTILTMISADSTDRKNLSYDTYYYRAWGILVDTETGVRDTIYGDIRTIDLMLAPAVMETYPIFNRVRLAAIVCGKFTEKGDAVEWGAVLSERVNPTINDTRVRAADMDAVTGEFGVLFDNLKPLNLYHTRVYARYSDGTVSYGPGRIFQTTRGGNSAWSWARNESGARAAIEGGVSAYERITEAMDSAMYYYNNYSNLYIRSNVEYNTGVQTADCSFGGWIRFGPNTRYQWVGTAQHELCHGLGVGTASNWRSLIQFDGVRQWSRPYAQLTLRVVLKDMTQILRGDGQHFWNAGINQREEVTNGTTNSHGVNIRNAEMLKANALVMNAMRIDGLIGPTP